MANQMDQHHMPSLPASSSFAVVNTTSSSASVLVAFGDDTSSCLASTNSSTFPMFESNIINFSNGLLLATTVCDRISFSPSASSSSSSSSSCCLEAATTKCLPLELVFELLKFVPERVCLRKVHQYPWLYHLCTKFRQKYWQYANMLERDAQLNALNIRLFRDCIDDRDYMKNENFAKILANEGENENVPGIDFKFNVRLHLAHVNKQQILNQLLHNKQDEFKAEFGLLQFNYYHEQEIGTDYYLETCLADFPTKNYQSSTLFKLIGTLNAAMNLVEQGRANQLANTPLSQWIQLGRGAGN